PLGLAQAGREESGRGGVPLQVLLQQRDPGPPGGELQEGLRVDGRSDAAPHRRRRGAASPEVRQEIRGRRERSPLEDLCAPSDARAVIARDPVWGVPSPFRSALRACAALLPLPYARARTAARSPRRAPDRGERAGPPAA